MVAAALANSSGGFSPGSHIEDSIYWLIVDMFPSILALGLGLLSLTSATILQNGQIRETNYPNTTIDLSAADFETYDAGASEIHYMGRWDPKHVSHWSYVQVPISALELQGALGNPGALTHNDFSAPPGSDLTSRAKRLP